MKNKSLEILKKLVCTLLATVFSASAIAQGSAPKKNFGKSKVVQISFENELVRGSAENPSVENVFVRDEFNFKKMIKLRKNFIPEASREAEVFNGK